MCIFKYILFPRILNGFGLLSRLWSTEIILTSSSSAGTLNIQYYYIIYSMSVIVNIERSLSLDGIDKSRGGIQ